VFVRYVTSSGMWQTSSKVSYENNASIITQKKEALVKWREVLLGEVS